jgi:hypothetical protein
LPADEIQRQLGTVLHERQSDGSFTEISTLPFLRGWAVERWRTMMRKFRALRKH